jgi:hypothetical protein
MSSGKASNWWSISMLVIFKRHLTVQHTVSSALGTGNVKGMCLVRL